MSSIPNLNKAKGKTSGQSFGENEEQMFSIQPHPAKSNNPGEVEEPQVGAGLNSNPELQAHHARGPHVPSPEILNRLEQPKTHEELEKRTAELNRK
ncbi:hypothetical protein BJ138DRAFT_997734 [Hygrophoropsis aurantiaca]|uniref:Uncharacterized protein n=1 Tax=Hygrophoropsis aurantiaca TaxID=72124 RepID=A0ACB8AQS8_9AGAM|nr:hypothetical protein BJ138DRAFT_997734 [Hygrophoropsis aurantiaca]